MSRPYFVAAGLWLAAGVPAFAQATEPADLISVTYACARGVTVPVVYVNSAAEDHLAIAMIDGHLVAMRQVISASGARYRSESEDLPYQLWSKGDGAMLSYGPENDADDLFTDCTVLGPAAP